VIASRRARTSELRDTHRATRKRKREGADGQRNDGVVHQVHVLADSLAKGMDSDGLCACC
jgi:hypothetical protein